MGVLIGKRKGKEMDTYVHMYDIRKSTSCFTCLFSFIIRIIMLLVIIVHIFQIKKLRLRNVR